LRAIATVAVVARIFPLFPIALFAFSPTEWEGAALCYCRPPLPKSMHPNVLRRYAGLDRRLPFSAAFEGGTMKRLMLSVAAMLTAGIVVVNAEKQGHKGHTTSSQVSGSVHVVFSTDDVRVIREYYAPRYRALPPGLQKKYDRTGQLPPGWQKKLQPLDPVVERRLVALPAGYRRGIVDGRAVIMDDRTHVLIDVAVLF
jgi:hypothetical protein